MPQPSTKLCSRSVTATTGFARAAVSVARKHPRGQWSDAATPRSRHFPARGPVRTRGAEVCGCCNLTRDCRGSQYLAKGCWNKPGGRGVSQPHTGTPWYIRFSDDCVTSFAVTALRRDRYSSITCGMHCASTSSAPQMDAILKKDTAPADRQAAFQGPRGRGESTRVC